MFISHCIEISMYLYLLQCHNHNTRVCVYGIKLLVLVVLCQGRARTVDTRIQTTATAACVQTASVDHSAMY